MKSRLTLCLIGFLFCSSAFAQQKVKVKVSNQYEAPVDNFTVDGIAYKTSKDGSAIIAVAAIDSLVFAGAEYNPTKIAVSDIKDGANITIQKSFTWKDIVNPMFYIKYGGLWLLLFIIFAETGIFAGFFLPGDSLLFVAGIFSNSLAAYLYDTNNDFLNLLLIISLVTIAGVLGNATGYWFGKKVGPTMYGWKNNLLFKQKYLLQAHDFYEKHGGGAIVFARFLPIVRTFAPIVAGIVKMDRKKFGFYNVAGCIAWATVMLAAGHYLDKLFIEKFGIDLKKHLEIIVIVIVVVTTAPVLIKMLGGRKK